MKNKKGFTLIELLAVIVILAIIALIAVPIVLNMISKAKKSAARTSTLGYVDSIEYYAGFQNVSNDTGITGYNVPLPEMTDGKVTCTKTTSGWNTECSTFFEAVDEKAKGDKPKTATIVISSNGKVLSGTSMVYNGYTVNYDGKDAYIEDNSNTPAEPTTKTIELNSDTIGSVTSNTNHEWFYVSDDMINLGMWESSVTPNAYYKEKIVVTQSRPATIKGKLASWYNCGSPNAKYRIGFSTTNDDNKDSFTEYKDLSQTYNSAASNFTRNECDTFAQDFEVTITEPGEYYIKAVYYMYSRSCSSYSRLYDLKITQ